MRVGRAAVSLLTLLLCSAPVHGQTRNPRFEISAGGLFAGGHDLTSTSADLVRNQQGGGDFPVFQSETRMDSAPALEGRVGWRLTSRLTIEGGVFFSRPQLTSRLTDDIEDAPDATIVEDLSLYIFDAAVLIPLGATDSRFSPFVRAGAGYLRQLHEGNVLVETGQAYHVGGGLTAWLGRSTRLGLRMDARVYLLQGGVDLGESSRTMAAGGAGMVFAF
jgi:hypothetical protein